MSGSNQDAIYTKMHSDSAIAKEGNAVLNLEIGPDQVVDYRKRGQWLRAAILGANDGLLSTASLMLGVGAVKHDAKSMVISGLAGVVAGACSMGIGEFVSVCSQRDIELSNRNRGVTAGRAVVVASANNLCPLTEDNLNGDEPPSPVKAACASSIAFCVGGAVPLVAAAFVEKRVVRLAVTVSVSSVALATFGLLGAYFGRSPLVKSSLRVLLGGWSAMIVTFGVLYVFASAPLQQH